MNHTTELKKGKLIGRGAFTRCYKLGEDQVLLESCCPAKECMSFGWGNTGDLFPKLERVEFDEYSTYVMKRYPKTRGLKSHISEHQWSLYKALRALPINFGGDCDGSNHWYNQFNSLPDQFEDEKEQLLEMLNAMGNYGADIGFEISPRNVAVDNGKLVLLDCFFMISKLKEVRKNLRIL